VKIFVLLFLTLCLYGDVALVSTKDLKFKQALDYGDLKLQYLDKKIHCKMFDKQKLLTNKYKTIRYIPKNKAICEKDVVQMLDHKIKADFGNIVIEKNGEFVSETKNYVKIKKQDGSIEKINKNGMTR